MGGDRMKISKIENTAARHVTFCKRRRGLFKKAQELAILCDVDIGVMVFSSAGKLYDFSSISMKDIIQKYCMNTNNGLYKPDHASPELQLENAKYESQETKIEEFDQQFSHFKGEDIEGLPLTELLKLETMLEKGLRCVLQRKGEKIMEAIGELQNKGEKLMAENELLIQKVMEITKTKEQEALLEPARISQVDMESSASFPIASSTRDTGKSDDISDTDLKLGLPLN